MARKEKIKRSIPERGREEQLGFKRSNSREKKKRRLATICKNQVTTGSFHSLEPTAEPYLSLWQLERPLK